MAHDGLARTIRPVHTMIDGDLVFALSLGEQKADAGLVASMVHYGTYEISAIKAELSEAGIPVRSMLQPCC